MHLYFIILLGIIIIFSALCSVQDFRTMMINNYSLWAACFSVLICHLIFNRTGMWVYVLSSMIFGTFYYIIRFISKKKLGIGDVYFGFFQGLCIPLKLFPVCTAIEIILVLLVVNKKIGRKQFPFVPFMSVGLLISYIISYNYYIN